MTLRIGDRAPDFTLPSTTGERVTLRDLLGRRSVVLFFYPKDETTICTAEACTFRDHYADFADAGAEVVGISADPPESHARFAGRHALPMKLLSDTDGTVRALYGVRPTFGVIPPRTTFVVDRQGIVRHVFSSLLRYQQHVREALDVVRGLEAGPAGAQA